MRYESSLTANVQAYISQTLAKRVAEANSDLTIYTTAKEIREYLSDVSTINTPDFVLRRFIQDHCPDFQNLNIDAVDLTKSKNVTWSDDMIKSIAQRLSKISMERHGLNISSTIWRGYLSGAGARKRSSVFKLAFVLQMGVEETLELLMAFDMEPYSVRYPLDLICLFCQHQVGTYTWKDVEEMLHAFETGKVSAAGVKGQPQIDMTQCILTELQSIFERDLPGANAKAALVEYMIKHSGEFRSFAKGAKEIYLPGYSLGRLNHFLKLTQYLSVLYPRYDNSIAQETKPGEFEYGYVKKLEDGYPGLYGLSKAMFQSQNWKIQSGKKDKDEQEDVADDYDAGDYIYNVFIGRYLDHAMAIDRLRTNGKNVDFFERKDALIYAFFLIMGYLQLLEYPDSESVKIMNTFNAMIYDGDEFDLAIGDVFAVLEDMDNDIRFECIGRCLNIILTQLNYTQLYLPAPFDRFVLLSLMSTDPDGISPIILHAAYLEDYEAML